MASGDKLTAGMHRALLQIDRDDMTAVDIVAVGTLGADSHFVLRALAEAGLIVIERPAFGSRTPNRHSLTVAGAAMQARLLAEGVMPDVRQGFGDPAPVGEPVYRDPCPRCGVRGDVGCAHVRKGWPAGRLAVRA